MNPGSSPRLRAMEYASGILYFSLGTSPTTQRARALARTSSPRTTPVAECTGYPVSEPRNAAATDVIVCTRGGRDSSQRAMRRPCDS